MASDGKELVISNRMCSNESFCVTAVEIISLGNSFFFRSCSPDEDFLIPIAFCDIKERLVSSKNVNSKKFKIPFKGIKKKKKVFAYSKTKINKEAPLETISEEV